MTIYGEFLFMENAISGAVILMLTGKLCGYRIATGKNESGKVSPLIIIVGSIMCGAYAFILFVNLHWAMALACKLAFSAIIVLIVFRPTTTKSFIKAVIGFYAVSFLMGGITIALMYMTGAPGMSANGSLYLYGVKYLQIMFGILASAAIGIWLSENLVEKMHRELVITEIEIHIGEHVWNMKAFVDTGNFLRDPVSGYPAVIVSASGERMILKELEDESESRCCVIPYRSVGRRGMLYGLRPDYITVESRELRKVVLAFSDDDFAPWNGEDDYDVLLQQQLLEGRI